MPNDVKAVVSLVTLAVALVLAYWSGSPIRSDYSTFVVVTAVLMMYGDEERFLSAVGRLFAENVEIRRVEDEAMLAQVCSAQMVR